MNGLKCPEAPKVSEKVSEGSQIELTSSQFRNKIIKACALSIDGSRYIFFRKETGIWFIESLFEQGKIDQETKEFYLSLVESELPEDGSGHPLTMIVEDISETSESSLVM